MKIARALPQLAVVFLLACCVFSIGCGDDDDGSGAEQPDGGADTGAAGSGGEVDAGGAGGAGGEGDAGGAGGAGGEGGSGADCTDEDEDGYGEGCENGADCDDENPNCNTDCTDEDGDGYCTTTDCNDDHAAHWDDCNDCVDDDGDNYGTDCNVGEDCDDSNFACNTDCTDEDGDGWCVTHDCDDDDARHWSDCDDCLDGDRDGYGVDCDLGGDCNDDDSAHWDDCDDCVDGDTDGYGTDCNLGDDCDDTSAAHWDDCNDCVDGDTDGYGTDCNLGDDCDDEDPLHWSDCGNCVDGDTDGYGTDCDLGEDCEDGDPAINPGAQELCNDTDDDCDTDTPDGADETWYRAACDGGDTPNDAVSDSDLCQEGRFICESGLQQCDDNTADDVEVCNSADDDCDGFVDNVEPSALEAECSALFPSAVQVLTWGCSKSCFIESCAAGYSNCDGIRTNGCETTGGCDCTELDSVAGACNEASLPTISVPDGGEVTVSSADHNIYPTGDVDWYKVTFAAVASCGFSPRISLQSQGNPIKMRVYTSCAQGSTDGLDCGAADTPTDSYEQIETWETTMLRSGYQCGDHEEIDPVPPTSAQCEDPANEHPNQCTGSFIAISLTLYVIVEEDAVSTTCMNYSLLLSNL